MEIVLFTLLYIIRRAPEEAKEEKRIERMIIFLVTTTGSYFHYSESMQSELARCAPSRRWILLSYYFRGLLLFFKIK